MLNDLIKESNLYTERQLLHEQQAETLKACIDLLYQKQNNHEEAKAFFMKYSTFTTDHLTPLDAAYQEIISAGDLGIIQNDSLKRAIVDYYQMNKDIAIQIKEFNEVSTREMSLTKINHNLNFLKYLLDYHRYPEMYQDIEWSFLNKPASPKFKALENLAVLNIFREMEHASLMGGLLEKNSLLRQRIREELGAE